MGGGLRPVECSTCFVWQTHWLTHSVTHRQADFIICPMLRMHWADNNCKYEANTLKNNCKQSILRCIRKCSMSVCSFYRASICEGGLGSRNSVRLSVRPSVCPSATRVDCDKTKWHTADILIPHERAITLLLCTNSGWWTTPPSLWNLRSNWPTPFEKRRLRPISAYNVSTVGDSKKV